MPYDDRDLFYERRDEIGQIEAELKALKGRERVDFYRDNRMLLALRPMVKTTEKQLKALRRQRDAIYARDIPRREQERQLEKVDARMKQVIDRFNRRYKEATGG